MGLLLSGKGTLVLFGFTALIITVKGEVFPKKTYCDISTSHTMCIYEDGRQGPACENTAVPYTVKEEDKIKSLEIINNIRSQVALGNNPAGTKTLFKFPSAANMNSLVWDDELAAIAERWVYQCIKGHENDIGGSKEIANGRLASGQNLFRAGASADEDWTPDWKAVFNTWFQEYNLITQKLFETGSDAEGMAGVDFHAFGHDREVLYGSTTSIGCGVMRFKSDGALVYHVICNFGSPKNNPGNAYYYVTGDPASQCPDGYIGDKNKGLCEKSSSIPSTAAVESVQPVSPTDPQVEE